MEIVAEHLNGVKVLKPFVFEDSRGNFVKPFHHVQMREVGIDFSLKEEFFSSSSAGVLRGMHFQEHPHAHQKLIYCITGKVIDVLLDLRKDSETYGQSVSLELSAENRYVIYIPVGFAHGFYSAEDNSCMVYKTDAVYSPEHDKGILWNSFGHDWPLPNHSAEISERDRKHIDFTNYNSPF
jgi:dTDP-4-dehydrorhamnose 3,5-epimerase